MKIALAHDWLNQMGGAEQVLERLVEMYPGAPVFTTIYGPALMPETYRRWDIRPTWLNQAPAIHRYHQPYLPLYPPAVESMNFDGYDLILSNKSGFIHGLRHTSKQLHICYCLAPTRYVWDYGSYAAREGFGRWVGWLIDPLIHRLRQWDFAAAQRERGSNNFSADKYASVDYFIAISTDIQARIKKYYQRDSVIIYPPVNTGHFQSLAAGQSPGDFYLIVSRLIPYKRIDLAVQALTRLGKRLIVVGEGRDRARLKKLAGPTVEFKGRLPGNTVAELMANCRAFLFPGFEDFGIAPVEAQAAGRPVIAFGRGGALDTVVEGQTGLFFHEQSVEALIEAIQQFETMSFDPITARANAERFSVERFKRELGKFVIEKWQGVGGRE
jgi:glycosyltransferase involved in cell wall biosynthesis